MDKHAHSQSAAIDPVCGMTVDLATTLHKARHGGADYFFCCSGCHEKFLADPVRHLQAAAPKSCCGCGGRKATAAAAATHVIDPVSGMSGDPGVTSQGAKFGQSHR